MQESRIERSRGRYWLIGILFFHTVNTYMDRACISSAAGAMQRDLNIDDIMMGYIFGIFAIGYALFQIPSGWLADVLGPRRVLAWVVSLWSCFTILTGAAFNAVSLLAIRFLFGVGEAGAFPGATRALYNWVPANERGIAQGLFHSGARVGAAISLFLMPRLIILVGWRVTFVINGIIGIAWVTLWLKWFRNDPKDHPGVNPAELSYIREGRTEKGGSSAKVPFAVIVTSGNMLLAMFQYIASNITFFISFTWLQPYMKEQWGPDAALYAPIPLIFGMFAHWISGAAVTYLHGKGYHVGSRRIPAMTGFVIGAAGLILTTQAGAVGPLPFVLCFSIAVFGVELTLSPSWSFCMDIGGESSGAVSGAMNMLGNLGSAFSAIIFP
ncbi:MAG: MFS transporter, partial [Phycisphaerales bacterium]